MSSVSFANLDQNNNENIVFHQSEFCKYPFIDVERGQRIYYKSDSYWISFVVLETVQSNSEGYENPWASPESELIVTANFFGEIAFDGIRHAYIPYWHYLNELDLIKILQELNKLATNTIEGYEPA